MKTDHAEQRVDDPQTAFKRFKEFTRRIVAVPKNEIASLKRRQYKKQKLRDASS